MVNRGCILCAPFSNCLCRARQLAALPEGPMRGRYLGVSGHNPRHLSVPGTRNPTLK